jgi:outer membrane protein OmpA-like peptidoglycan-associated protein
LAGVLTKHPKTSILVTGYTDATGSDELNNKLSWLRAESAKAELLQNSIKNKRVYTWGFGSKNPVATNDTPEGRTLNRRVEVIVLHDYQGQKK